MERRLGMRIGKGKVAYARQVSCRCGSGPDDQPMDAISGSRQPPAFRTGTEDIEDALEKPVVPLTR